MPYNDNDKERPISFPFKTKARINTLRASSDYLPHCFTADPYRTTQTNTEAVLCNLPSILVFTVKAKDQLNFRAMTGLQSIANHSPAFGNKTLFRSFGWSSRGYGNLFVQRAAVSCSRRAMCLFALDYTLFVRSYQNHRMHFLCRLFFLLSQQMMLLLFRRKNEGRKEGM